MKIALCQMAAGADKAANLAEIDRLAALAAEQGASLAVFPEFAMRFERRITPEFIAQAEPLDGPFVQRLAEIARHRGIVLVAGMLEEIPGEDRAYNTVVAVTAEGLSRTYRKAHLYDAFGSLESEFIRPGETDGPVTFELEGVRVGILTCYDLRFPEAARQHADAGVELLLYPAAWYAGPRKEDHWQTLARARAIENTIYVGAVSQAPGSGVGSSLVVDPMGVVLGELGEQPGVAVAEVEPERIAQVRRTNPSLANRRFAVVPKQK